MARHLISDFDLVLKLAAQYMSMGYQPIPVGGSYGRSWLYPRMEGYVVFDKDGELVSPKQMLVNFKEHPGSGIGIVGGILRDGSSPLLHIDVDVVSEEDDNGATMRAIANIIGMPCPVKHGSKGGNFTVRYLGGKNIIEILQERQLPYRGMVTATQFTLPWLKDKKYNKIDLLGANHKSSHTIVPPSVHLSASLAAGENVLYKWIPFPGTKKALRLEDVAPSDLPELYEHHLLLIYQWVKNPKSALWSYIGATSPSNHHAPMLAATTYLYHEGFTLSEIEEICILESERTSADDNKARERRGEIDAAIRALPQKIPDPRPAREPKEALGPKVPLERVMSEWLRSQYPEDDLASFSSIPYCWVRDHWEPVIDVTGSNPWRDPYNHLYNKFDTAVHKQIRSALDNFALAVPPRVAQPNSYLIPFANGVLDVRDLTLYTENRDDYIPARLKHDYDEHAKAPLWEAFLRNLMQPPLEYADRDDYKEDWSKACQAVEEFFGYCLVRSHHFQKLMFLIGRPGTGKSVIMKVLQGLLPRGWASTVSMDSMDDPNSRMQMTMAHVNIAGEVGRRSRDVDDVLLKITSGEPVEVKLLYQNRAQAILPTRLLFHGNLPPDTTDGTGAMERRTIMLRTTDIKPTVITNYEDRLLEEAPGILKRLVHAYGRLMARREFVPPAYAIEAASNMSVESNSCTLWIDEKTHPVEDIKAGMPSGTLFEDYMNWCQGNAMKPMPSVLWGKMLCALGYPPVKRKLPANRVVRYRKIRLMNVDEKVQY